MRVSFESWIDFSLNAIFMAEIKLENKPEGHCDYKGLWLSWWLYKPSHWRKWLWEYRNEKEDGYRCFVLRICGFEICWQKEL